MKKLTQNILAATAIALTLPVAAFAQAGAGTSGYSTGPGSPSATDGRQMGQAPAPVTTGTTGSTDSAMVHPANVDPSGHAGSVDTNGGTVSTTGTSTAPSTTAPAK